MTNDVERLLMCLFAGLEKHRFIYFVWFICLFIFGSFRREYKFNPVTLSWLQFPAQFIFKLKLISNTKLVLFLHPNMDLTVCGSERGLRWLAPLPSGESAGWAGVSFLNAARLQSFSGGDFNCCSSSCLGLCGWREAFLEHLSQSLVAPFKSWS